MADVGDVGGVLKADKLDLDLLENAHKKLKKREYMRNIMRFYREEVRDEMASLKAQVAVLQQEYTIRTRASRSGALPSKRHLLLPWKDVSLALRDDLNACENERDVLRERVVALAHLLRTTTRWVSINLTSMHANTPTWRNVTLDGTPASRDLGKAWITQQMYHNTDRMFGQYAYPPLSSTQEFYDIDVEATEMCFQYHHRRQYVVDVPMDFVLKAYKSHLCSVLMLDWYGYQANTTLKETSGNTTLHQLRADDNEWMNLVTGEFHDDDDRCVFVIQQIQDDATAPTTQRQRNRMIWLDMRPVDGGKTQIRVLYRFAQYFDSNGYVSLDDEARSWGCDLDGVPEDKKEITFYNYSTALLVQINANHQSRINAHLTRMMLHAPP
ncbi:hypothetical protein H310_14093 [Aphanomyces invadans]|uniref:Uncharacterized protein n=1 Tax=Aphanomyces invadans TaxID=157072 RepID=A0A024TB04_9STRA|nr:hypothetical protein H310_14093 [Aphanomyces invadans]ETV91228.1 hypothetical protein H310_14093 [Aphanomyces invadans]|eukprot:XP_008880065.1 hypothetical protein H310_14093 [Aphanomyces invadans]